jgi:hypothetical protein
MVDRSQDTQKLYALIHYHNSTSCKHVDEYVVVGIVDKETKDHFFRKLNMFARDFYDYLEFDVNNLSRVNHIMVIQ